MGKERDVCLHVEATSWDKRDYETCDDVMVSPRGGMSGLKSSGHE